MASNKTRNPAWLMKGKYDLSKINPDYYYIVDLTRIHNPEVVRLTFKTKELAKNWLRTRSNAINKMQYNIESGKVILEYNIPFTTYYQNASYRTKRRLNRLFRESGDNRGNNKYGSKVAKKSRFR